MNDTPALARGLLLWAAPLALIVGVLGWETDWGRNWTHDSPPDVKGTPQPVSVALLPEYRIEGGLGARKETVDRVLFNPTRRAAPPGTQAGGPSAMQHGQYTLSGTTIVDHVATAFLREVNGGRSHTVRQGDTLNGIRVAEVTPDHVRLTQNGESEDLQLKVATGPRTTVQTAGVPLPGTAAVPSPVAPALNAPGGGNAGAARQAPVGQAAAAAAAAAPGAAPRKPGVVSVGELLAERRRAAQAAAAAGGGTATQPGGLP